MIDHMGVTVRDLQISKAFYDAAFAPLASAVLYVETPGLMNTDFAAIDYQRRDMNFWPRVENPWA